VRFALAAFDEGYLILLRHGTFYGEFAGKDPRRLKKSGVINIDGLFERA